MDINYYIHGNGNQTVYKLNDVSTLAYECTPRTPGFWNIYAEAVINDSVYVSNKIIIEMQFPSYSIILNDPDISSQMNNTWSETKAFASSDGRREKGFWIYMDTRVNAPQIYFKEDIPDGPIITGSEGTNGSILATPPTLEEITSSPLQGGKYVVAIFHTHTPLTYIDEGNYRLVGESDNDIAYSNNQNIPGFVYDYIGGQYENILSSGNVIVSMHNLNEPSKIYKYGPNRRTTLPN